MDLRLRIRPKLGGAPGLAAEPLGLQLTSGTQLNDTGVSYAAYIHLRVTSAMPTNESNPRVRRP